MIINNTEEKDRKYHIECQSTPDNLTVRMQTPGGDIDYPIPIMKVQKYTIDEIFENGLLFLIPFYIFSYEKFFDQLENDENGCAKLKREFATIRKRLDILCADGVISEYTKCTIWDVTKKVVENIARHVH